VTLLSYALRRIPALWAGLLLVAIFAGIAGCAVLPPGDLPPIPTVPTVLPLADTPTPASTPSTTPRLPTIAPTITPRPTRTGSSAPRTPGDYLEPSRTPPFPVSATPTIYLTPQPAFEGPLIIGRSQQGRAIEAYRFGNGPIKRMTIHGIHGGYEGNTVALADELIEHLKTHPELVPAAVTLYVVRNINPDGYARDSRGPLGRTNANGVDLNRNFPVHWAAEWDRYGCWTLTPTSSGSAPGSEPEVEAVMAFILQVRPTGLISYHSAALGIFPGALSTDIDMPNPDSLRLAKALAAASDYAYPPIDTGCTYTGTLSDWAAANGVAAVALELHTHEFTDFDENLGVLQAFLAWRR